MRVSRLLSLAAVAAVVVIVGAGCSSSKKSSSVVVATTVTTAAPAATTTGAPPAAGDTVTIKDFTFSPTPITVPAGATVSVLNKDTVDHTITSNDKTSFDTKHVGGGKSATFVAPTKAGSYQYHCAIHQYMKATLVVQ